MSALQSQLKCDCRSYAQLRATFEEYQKLSDKDIADSVSAEMSGDLKQGMLTVSKYSQR